MMNVEMGQDWTMAFMMASNHIPALGRTTAGFLADWFVLFWDLYMAKIQSKHHPQPQKSPSDTFNPQKVDKRLLIQRFMTVIGLGKRDPATLNEEEKRYLMAMVQRYSSQPVVAQQLSSHLDRKQQPPPPPSQQQQQQQQQQQKKPRTETAPTGISFPGHQHGPIGTFTPPFPPSNNHNAKQQQNLGIPDPMDRMMASMLSSIIGGSLEPSIVNQPTKRPINQELYFKPTNAKTLEPRSSSQPLEQSINTHLLSSPLLTRSASAIAGREEGNGREMMITPMSLSPTPQPILDAEMESMLSNGSPKIQNGGSIEPLDTKTIGNHGGRVGALVCLDHQHIASGGKDGQVKVFNKESGVEVASLALPNNQSITSMLIKDRVLLTFGVDRTISILNWSNQKLSPQTVLFGHQANTIQCIGLTMLDDRLVIVTCDFEGSLMIWERQQQQQPDQYKFKPIWTIQLQRNGAIGSAFHHLAIQASLCAVSTNDEIIIVNLEKLAIQKRIPCKFAVLSISFHQGMLLATGCNTCCIFDPTADYVLKHSSPSFADKVYCCALLPNHHHNLIVAIGSYQKIFLWKVASQTISEFNVHSSIVSCLVVSGDNLITSGHDGVIKVHKVKAKVKVRVDSFEDDLDAVLKGLD